jgi:hypothetical protein
MAAAGCKSEEPDSAYVSGYTLSRDFELERRILRIQRSRDIEAECMQSGLPVGTSPQWKRTALDAETHGLLIELLFDQGRYPNYRADTEASVAAEVFLCGPRPGGGEYCYAPEVGVTGLNSPWLFGLPPAEVELSAESLELIDAFLAGHDACWSGGEPMGGGGE